MFMLMTVLCAILGYVTLVWLLSVIVGRVSIIDAFWGPGFVLTAGIAFALSEAPFLLNSQILLLAMTCLWGSRLGIHLAIRILHEVEEDRRYAAMRRKYDPGFWYKSLGIVFVLQGVILWFVAMPLVLAFDSPVRTSIPAAFWAGVPLWAVGLYFETIGDWQLARFRADASNHGKVLRTGLWRLTRHPNYFGDFLVWWGLWICSVAAGAPLWSILSPVVMSVFLMKFSGVGLLEKDIAGRRPEYVDYVRETNAFFPAFPRLRPQQNAADDGQQSSESRD